MTTLPNHASRNGGIIAAVGVAVLLIGTATGNAITMLVLSIAGLAAICIIERKRLHKSHFLVICLSASVACILAYAMTTNW